MVARLLQEGAEIQDGRAQRFHTVDPGRGNRDFIILERRLDQTAFAHRGRAPGIRQPAECSHELATYYIRGRGYWCRCIGKNRIHRNGPVAKISRIVCPGSALMRI
jgi:hypothetical protein